jgi:Protein of unknown function DUF72/Uracil DNA glycosylase superfamily
MIGRLSGRGSGPDVTSLTGLAADASRCRSCPLWEHATQVVFGTGPSDARIIAVGEQPGDQEDRAGQPFVGPAGRVLDDAFDAAGISRLSVWLDPERWLENHVDRVVRLGAHLGPNLLQLPPRWRRDVDRLDHFLSVAPRTIRWAVELRDPSWLHPDTYATLERHGAALCIHDLLPDHPVVRTAAFTYRRFHGPNALVEPYQHRYGAQRLRPAVEQLAT